MPPPVKQNHRREKARTAHYSHAGGGSRRRPLSRSLIAVVTAAGAPRLVRGAIRGTLGLVCAVILLLGGCGEDGPMSRFMLKPDHIIVERRPDQAYERLFPYYVELCATSQFRSKLKGEGGVAGHAVMYIKGACKDEKAPYPQLRRCESQRPSSAILNTVPVSAWAVGSATSTGWRFRATNFSIEGNLKFGERLTQAHFEATVRDAIEKGIYKGVDFHDYPSAAAERAWRFRCE